MIGLGVGIGDGNAVVGNTGRSAAWPSSASDASDTHLPEMNVTMPALAGSATPTVNPNRRLGVPGLRGVRSTLARTGIPLLPKGPTQVARMGQGMNAVGRQPQRTTKVQQFVPVQSAEQAGDWYQFLR